MLTTPIGTMPIEMIPRGATPQAIRFTYRRLAPWAQPQWEVLEPWASPCLAQGIH